MTKSPVDQMVEAAIWLMVQGDRAGAEALLKEALRVNPGHHRALQTMKLIEKPGGAPSPRRSSKPSMANAVPPRSGPPSGKGLPFVSTPSSLRIPAQELEDSEPLPTPPPEREPVRKQTPQATVVDAREKNWWLEILTGPHLGKSLAISKRPMVVGRDLGMLDLTADPFMAVGHASLFRRNGQLWICNGTSLAGTWVSINRPERLAPGDSLSVGLQRLRYLGPIDTPTVRQPRTYGAPCQTDSWRLEQVLVGDRPGRTWVLRGVATVGREGTVRLAGEEISRVHAELRPVGGPLEVINRSGRSATFVALSPGAERPLADGLQVRLGTTVFRVTAR